MEKIITIKIVNKYGNDLNYPVCNDAKLLCELTGKKTFSNADLFTVKGLGYQIKVETPTLNLGDEAKPLDLVNGRDCDGTPY